MLTVVPKGEVFTQEEFETLVEKLAEAWGRADAEGFRKKMQADVDKGVSEFQIHDRGGETIH